MLVVLLLVMFNKVNDLLLNSVYLIIIDFIASKLEDTLCEFNPFGIERVRESSFE